MKLGTQPAVVPKIAISPGWGERLGLRVLGCIAEQTAEADSIREILNAIVAETGIAFAGIRLRVGDDYPYYTFRGFSQEFILAENSLCEPRPERTLNGGQQKSQPALVCLCGRVISGQTDPEQRFFTEGGSFYTASLQQLAATAEPARLGPLRGRCIVEGFETHALIPLRHGAETIGLIHLCDPRPGVFSADDIAYFERLGSSVTVALECKRLLRESEQRSNEAVRRSEETFSKIFLASPESIVVASLLDGSCRDVNEVFLQKTGYRREEVTGLSSAELNLWVDPRERQQLIDRLRRDRRVRAFETKLRMRSGEIRDCLISSEVIEIDGIEHSLNFIVDITERKRAEEERRKLQARLFESQKFESIGALASGVAHDFNNLLGGIMGGLSIVDIRLGPDSELHEEIEQMIELVERGAELTKQLLSFARLGKLKTKPLDLNEVLKKTAEMFGRTRKDIVIRTQYAPGVPTVEADRTQLEQVILNLLVNAGQAMPNGGDLALSTSQVEFSNRDAAHLGVVPGRYVTLSVVDTGIGMDAETRERIFEPFFTTKVAGQGTGLGLASVLGIVKNHGGAITVESEQGKGTTFIVYLPACERPKVAEAPPPVTPQHGSETILIVDDEEHIVRTCKLLLEAMGYRVLTANSGREAVEIFRGNQRQISLVILDLTMPSMSGSQTFDALREISPDAKVLLSSGYGIEGQASALIDRGCNGFIQKPFSVATLSAKLKELL